ncbi:MAG: antibiotic biosynthesis monooxygenase [Oricola sp.]
MYTTLSEVRFEDLARFISIFSTAGAKLRAAHGSRSAEVFGFSEEADRAMILIDWESRDAFDAFLADPNVPTTMASGGLKTRPTFTPVERVAAFPA